MILKKTKLELIDFNTKLLQDNLNLDCSINSKKIEYCKRVFRETGFMPAPIAGRTPDNDVKLLHGQCEVKMLRESGESKIPLLVVDLDDKDGGDKITLQLLRLNKHNNNAVVEALTIKSLLNTGKYTLNQIANMIGQSESWVSKRSTMIKRLEPDVLNMLGKGDIGVRAATEISKIPRELQVSFAFNAISQKLTKRNIEKLTPLLSSSETTEKFKETIVSNPLEALRIIGKEESINEKLKKRKKQSQDQMPTKISNCKEIRFITVLTKEVESKVAQNINNLDKADENALEQLNNCLMRLSKLILSIVNKALAPGQEI